jgi:mannose-6-phosphate isomerase-like protein (cupin superfamily)
MQNQQERVPVDKGVPSWLGRKPAHPFDLFEFYFPRTSETQKFVSKSWGYENWIINSPLYCGKILFIKKGKYTSWHYHEKKDECFYILNGELNVLLSWDKSELTAQCVKLHESDSLHIPTGMVHRLYGHTDVTLIEISTHHEDSDSIRLNGDGTVIK